MSTIAITGKGGVGKTTISALTVQWLIQNGNVPVLAIDADSNANFNELLGVQYALSVGGVREEARNAAKTNPGVSKQEFLEMQIQRALVEQNGFDFLVMGRPEGPGCYCYANNVLRDVITRVASSYRFLVIDCEAGLEHLSRRTILNIDYLITVSDPSIRGLTTAGRVSKLLEEMKTRVKHRDLIINKLFNPKAPLTPEQQQAVAQGGFEQVHRLPLDEAVSRMDETGGSAASIPQDSPVRVALGEMLGALI